MTDVITAVLQLPAPIAAAVTLEAGEIITAQIVQPAAPIAATITVAGPAGPAGPTGATGPAGPTGPAGTGGSGAVASVFGRTGTVTAQSGDYTAAQIGADTAAARDTAITTATAPLATSSALTTGLAGKQPLDSDLTTIAALDSAQAGVVASDGAGWIRKTYSQLKTALSITAADVGADTSAARDTAISTAINNLINSAPGTLDTLGEIATALQADESTAAALATTVAGKQPLDADLTAIASLDASTAGAIASDGAGWVKKTYAQFKTALGLVKADVGLGNVDNTADSAKTFTESQVTGLVADLAAKVPTTRTVAGHALSADVTLAEGDITNLTTDLAAKAPVSTTTIDLVDRTNNTTETVPAGTTTNCSTAGVTKTAPALDSPVGTPPKRFSVKNLAASTITVAYPDQAGVAQSLVVLPAETRTFRQKTTSGWGVESGAIAVATLDARFQPLDADLTGLADPTSSSGTLVSDGSTWLRKTAAQFKTWLGLVAADIPTIAESQVTNLTTDLAAKVPTTRTVAGHALSADVTLVKADVGLGNVDNTADTAKPVSTAQQAALDALVIPKLVLPITCQGAPLATATSTATSGNARFARVIIPKAGFLRDLTYYVSTQSGNVRLMVYDTGDASAGSYTSIWTSASTAVSASGGWQSIDPGASTLSVTAGQQVMFGLVFDNSTAVYGRSTGFTANPAAQLPSAFMVAAGGALPKLSAQATVTFGSLGAISEASMTAVNTTPVIIARFQ